MAEEQTAQEAWTLITNLFLDNKMMRAVYLEAEFCGVVQGDLSVTAYFHRLKSLSDALRDVGTPVSDQAVILNSATRPSNKNGGGNSGGVNTGGNRNGSDKYYGKKKKKKKNGGGNNNNVGGTSGGGQNNRDAGSSSGVGPWVYFNPYTGQAQQAPPVRPNSGAGLLGPRPPVLPPASAFTSLAPLHGQAFGTNPPPIPGYNNGPAWDVSALVSTLNNAATPSTIGEWVINSGATSHMASDSGMRHNLQPSTSPSSITVGNGSTLPITHIGHSSLSASARKLLLKNVLLVPHILKNLISIRRFTIDNLCSIEFDPFGFSVKDLRTKAVILRCNSRDDL
ncbi:unnamed protein product [Alopecurus aequalis]